MKLFTDFESHVIPYLAASVDSTLSMLQPYFDMATDNYLVQILGQGELDVLIADFEGNTTSTLQDKLLISVRTAIVNFGYMYFTADSTFTIGDGGLVSSSNNEVQRPHKWMVREFKKLRVDAGWSALSKISQFLYTNMGVFSVWRDSDERKEWGQFFVWELVVFNRYRKIATWGTHLAMANHMRSIEEEKIRGMITLTIYDEIKAQILAGTLSNDNLTLLPYIQKAVVHGTMVEAYAAINFIATSKGIMVFEVSSQSQNDESSRAISEDEREKLIRDSEMKFNNALCSLEDFLNENATDAKYIPYYDKFVNIEEETPPDRNANKSTINI